MGLHADTARTIVGILGNIISLFLFLSPIPTFVKIHKDKDVQAFKPHPYLATLFNCMMWMLYGMPFVHPDSTLVITINGIGFVIQASYVTIFLIYSGKPKRKEMFLTLLVEVIAMVVVILITMICFHTTKSRSTFVGILCIILNIGMYIAPLTVMKRVITTKSVKYMPFYLSLASFCNGIVWTIYALIKFDINILVPNGLGTLSGLVQLVLYAAFYKTTNWDDDDDDTNQSDLELQNSSSGARA